MGATITKWNCSSQLQYVGNTQNCKDHFKNSPSLPNPTLQTYTDFDIKLAKIARQTETAHPQPKFFSRSIGTLCTETAQVWMRTWKIQCTSGRYCGMGEEGCRARKPETECCDVMSELEV